MPPPPHTSAPPRVGDEGREGRTAPPPPVDKAARWGGSGERVRDGPHDRARRKQAPAGQPGVRTHGRKGNDGSHTATPPPCRGTSAAPRACAMLATCLRQRTDSESAPPPHPFSLTRPGKGRGQQGGGEGTWGGGRGQTDMPGGETGGERWRRKKKNSEQSKPTRQGKKARRQGPKPQRTGGGGGDMGPQGTLAKNPTTGV